LLISDLESYSNFSSFFSAVNLRELTTTKRSYTGAVLEKYWPKAYKSLSSIELVKDIF